ncbi:MAG TPA: hypothetical protein VF553_02500 [Pyrinomonadaceae bacterium]|jgi:hypothetical protein
MLAIELNQDIKPYHLAPLLSALIVIAMSVSRSDVLLGTLFLLNVLAVPFLTGVVYVCSLADSGQGGWKSVSLGAWPTVLATVVVNLLLGNWGTYVLFIFPVLLLMASLGGIVARIVRLRWGRSSD